MNRGAVAVLMVLVTTLTACGGQASPSPFSRGRGGQTSIQIHVDNQNFSDMTLLAVTIRGRHPLGRVGGSTQRTFSLDWRRLDEIRIRMEVLAGDEYQTNPVNAAPGDRLELTIQRDPRNAFLRRRR
jgi:hypothetical protein